MYVSHTHSMSAAAGDPPHRASFVRAWLEQVQVYRLESDVVTLHELAEFVFGAARHGANDVQTRASLKRVLAMYYVRGEYAALWPALDCWHFPCGAWKRPGPCMYNVHERRFICALTYDEVMRFSFEPGGRPSGTRRSP